MLSFVKSNFDEEALISDDDRAPVLPPAEQYCLTTIWVRPALSTISYDDIVTDDISVEPHPLYDIDLMDEAPVVEITDRKASEILQKEEEFFARLWTLHLERS
ncbi:hypothetical protein GCK32_002227 [Trichostrongylus colubriformis]|uniref:Uncharacterized protein n=1 Tax=Trichostrongylus colubriformis TaxID=6319 RepID=A0AAN8ITY6_TRICO